ncbi:hypothetical protein HY946_02245, partial [Candidatus Gottesmanbacteria bacterium]|nr:hypothetical protein [Candidatus Gottesmanbacteria bacterium]
MFKKPIILSLILIVILGLIPLSYFRDGKMIFGGDHGLWILNPWEQIKNNFFLWNTRGIEAFAPYFSLIFLPLSVLGIIQLLGFPPFVSEAVLLTLLFLGMGLGAYFLGVTLFGRKRVLLNLTLAIFYMFNPYSMIQWSIPSYINLASFVQYPIVLALFIRGLGSLFILKNSLIFALGSLFFLAGFFMPSYLLISFLTIFLYFIFHFFFLTENKKEKTQAFKYLFACGFFFFLFHAWWIIPLTSLFREGLSWFASSAMGLEWAVSNYSKRTSFVNLFTLQGWPGWGTDTFGYDKNFTENFFLIALSFFPLIFATLGLFLLSKIKNIDLREKKKILFFLAFFLLALFLNKGTHEPFSQLNFWLYRYLPGFAIFRTVFVKLGIMLSLSLAVLVGVGAESLKEFFNEKKIKFFPAVAVSIFSLYLVYNYPFFTGENILPKRAFSGSSPHHELPPSYLQAADYLNKEKELFKVFSLPGQGNWSVFNWENGDLYIGADVFFELVKKTFILAHTGGNLLKDAAYEMFEKQDITGIEKILGVLNAKYLLLHNDSNSSTFGTLPPQEVKEKLENYPPFFWQEKFGQLDLWQTSQDYFYPHLYLPEKETYLAGSGEKARDFFNLEDEKNINAIFFEENSQQSAYNFYNQKITEKVKNIFISSQPVNFAKLRDKYRQEVVVPFARFTPESKFYWYILQKEKKTEEALSYDPKVLLKTKLLFANKRLVELERLAWAEKYKYFQDSLKRYQEKMDEVVSLLEKEESQGRFTAELIVITETYLEKQNERLRARLEDELLPLENKQEILETLINNQRLARYLEEKRNKNFWLIDPQNLQKSIVSYRFNVPSPDKYQIFLKKEKGDSNFYELKGELTGQIRKIGLERKTFPLEASRVSDSWFSLSPQILEEGEYVFSLEKPQAKNLIGENDWKSLDKGNPAEVREDAVRLKAEDRPSVFLNQIKPFLGGEFYKLEFDYQTEEGIAPTLAIWQASKRDPDKETKIRVFTPESIILEKGWDVYSAKRKEKQPKEEIASFNLSGSPFWQHSETVFETKNRANSLFLALLVGENNERGFVQSTNNFKNFHLEKIFSNSLVLKSETSQIKPLPTIEFTKINPSLYKIKVINATQPFDLVFSESFHPGWKVYIKENSKLNPPAGGQNSKLTTIASYFGGQTR